MTMELPVIARVAVALVAAFLIAFITTPLVKSLAEKVGAVDVPKDNRRMHKTPIPRMGGLAIFLGFLLSTLVFVPLTTPVRGMLLGSVIIVVLGILDDIYALLCQAIVDEPPFSVREGGMIENGYDPEVDTRRKTPLTPGVDYSAYPKSRGVVFGLNLTF